VSFELDFDHSYRALESRDARFDGWFVVAVRTTGIYCRPSCPTPTRPKRQNVAFYRTAAAAQLAGFRACKRCRPDATPGSPEWDARADIVGRAMRLIGDGLVNREGVAGLARRLSISERHLHRLLVGAVGAPPLALARAQRAQTARLLIETTRLPFGELAFAAGFASVRQFNDTVKDVFAAPPSALRGRSRNGDRAEPGRLALRLPLRLPYDGPAMLDWLEHRAVPGLESGGTTYRRTLRLAGGIGIVDLQPADDHVRATFRLASVADLARAVQCCRRLLDLDADPQSICEALSLDNRLAPIVRAHPGRRAPGTVDGPETAIRTVIGQQISVTAARTIAARLVAAHGEPLDEPDGSLRHAFPSPEAIAEVELANLGLPGARRSTLRELAGHLASGTLVLDPGADRAEAREQLLAIRGIGPWTASYVTMRALGDPDVLPVEDLGIRRGAARLGLPETSAGLTKRAEQWRPWRTYAAHHLWAVDTAS
jgi:AraC family transcriptional regulator, regulatory protein of adaptative response / DNA-3-methyladenine glycosylase II